MSSCSSCPVVFLRLGLSGLVLLRLRLLMLTISVGGPIPSKGLVLGRESALFRVVRLGGHKVRKVRGSVADAHDAADVFLLRDSSIAPLFDTRRRSKAVMDVLDSMISLGVTLSRSVELTAQWGKILSIGPLHLVTLDDLPAVGGSGLGDFHHRFSDFIHGIVVRRRDEATRVWRNWLREDPLVHLFQWWTYSWQGSCSWWGQLRFVLCGLVDIQYGRHVVMLLMLMMLLMSSCIVTLLLPLCLI